MSNGQLAVLQEGPSIGRSVDGLSGISRPLSGGNFWCLPLQGGRLDLRQIGW